MKMKLEVRAADCGNGGNRMTIEGLFRWCNGINSTSPEERGSL